MGRKLRTVEDVRARLVWECRQPDVHPVIWERMVDKAYVNDAIDNEQGWVDLLDEYRYQLGLASSASPRRPPMRGEEVTGEEIPLSNDEINQAHLVNKARAKVAASLPPVRFFRQRVTGGTLTPEEARNFLLTPALAVFPLADLAAAKVPVVGHRVTSLEETSDDDVLRVAVTIAELAVTLVRPLPGPAFGGEPLYLAYSEPWGRTGKLSVAPNSVLDSLRMLTEWLADRLPWGQGEIAWFVLTDYRPWVPPLRAWLRRDAVTREGQQQEVLHRCTRGLITLEVEPWVEPATVQRVYRGARRIMLGGDNRPLIPRKRGVFHFVISHVDDNGQLSMTWRDLARKWNEQYPKGHRYHYEPGVGDANLDKFKRDYEHAERVLVTRHYRYPGDDLSHSPRRDGTGKSRAG